MNNEAIYIGPSKTINRKYLQNNSKNEIVHFDKKNKIVFVKGFGWMDCAEFTLPNWMV